MRLQIDPIEGGSLKVAQESVVVRLSQKKVRRRNRLAKLQNLQSDFQRFNFVAEKNLDPGGSSTKGILYIGIGTLFRDQLQLGMRKVSSADVVNMDTYLKILFPISNYGHLCSSANPSPRHGQTQGGVILIN